MQVTTVGNNITVHSRPTDHRSGSRSQLGNTCIQLNLKYSIRPYGVFKVLINTHSLLILNVGEELVAERHRAGYLG